MDNSDNGQPNAGYHPPTSPPGKPTVDPHISPELIQQETRNLIGQTPANPTPTQTSSQTNSPNTQENDTQPPNLSDQPQPDSSTTSTSSNSTTTPDNSTPPPSLFNQTSPPQSPPPGQPAQAKTINSTPPATPSQKKLPSKKKLSLVVGGLTMLLLLVGGGAAFYSAQQPQETRTAAAGPGEPCTTTDDCDPGYVCQGTTDSQVCQLQSNDEYCSVDAVCGGTQGYIGYQCTSLTNDQCLENPSIKDTYEDARIYAAANGCGQVDTVWVGGSCNRELCGGFELIDTNCEPGGGGGGGGGGTTQIECNSLCEPGSVVCRQELGWNYICWTNPYTDRSRCRLATNPTSSTCEPPSVTYSCDSACDSDDQCQTADASFICNPTTNTCRHQDYPDEITCTPPEDNSFACTNLSLDNSTPQIGDTLSFTCQTAGGGASLVNRFEFRYNVDGGDYQEIGFSAPQSNQLTSQPTTLVVSSPGSYQVQCRVCVDTNCTPWGQAQQ